jgi:hypothetical protein
MSIHLLRRTAPQRLTPTLVAGNLPRGKTGYLLGHTKSGKPIYRVEGGATVWRYPAQPMQQAAGTAVTAAALTSAFGTAQPYAVAPPQTGPMVVGTRIRLDCLFEVTSGSATPTLILGFYTGQVNQAIGSKTLIAATPALALPASVTAGPLILWWSGRVRAGSSGTTTTVYGQGWVLNVSSLTAFAGTPIPFPVTAAARTVATINNQQQGEFDVGVTLSAVTGSPSVTLADAMLEISG